MAETNVPGKQVRNQTIRNIDWDPTDPISWDNVDKTGALPADIGAAPNANPTFTGHVTVPTPTLSWDAVTKHYVDSQLGTPGAIIEFSVRSRSSDGPNRAAQMGDTYIVPSGVSYAAWLTHDLDIAEYAGSSWTFTDASSGWSAYIEDEFKYYTFMGGTWIQNTQLVYPYGVTGSVLTVDASGNPAWVYDTDTGSATYSASAYFSSLAGSASYASQAASSGFSNVAAALLTATGTVIVSGSASPVAGQVLKSVTATSGVWMTHKASVGCTTYPQYTNNHDGTLTVICTASPLTVALRSSDDHTTPIVEYTLAGTYGPFTAVATSRNYLYVGYNGGSPEVFHTTDVSLINESDTTPYITFGRIDRSGSVTAFSSASGGYVLATCASAHGLISIEDYVTLSGSPYDDLYQVTRVSSSEFKFPAVWTTTGTGTWNSVEIDALNWDEPGSGLQNKLHRRLVKTERFARESGVDLSEDTGRVIVVSDGVLWYGGRATSVEATRSDSASAKCYQWFHTGGVWDKVPVTQYSNSQYDDGSDLQTLGHGRYTVTWVYRDVSATDKCLHLVLGGTVSASGFTEIEAVGETPPTPDDLPPEMSVTAVLVGRIVSREAYATATQIDSAFNVVSYPSERLIKNGFDTVVGNGVVSGMQLSIGTDPVTATFSIASGEYYTPPSGLVQFSGATNQALTYLASAAVTYIALDVDENIIQKTSPYTESERRAYLLLGVVVHSNRTTVNAVNNIPDVGISLAAQYNDLLDALKMFNDTGNEYGANGPNLQLDKSVGSLFKRGVNFYNDSNTPHIIATPAATAITTLRFRTQTGVETANASSIDCGYYDVGGVRTPMPANKYQIMRIALFPSNLTRIQYGQAYYNKMSEALAAIATEPFVVEQNISENGLFRALLVVKSTCTDLTNTAEAQFVGLNRFGDIPQAAGVTSGVDLQRAYENSVPPQIITDDTRGAVVFQSGSASANISVFEVWEASGAVTTSVTDRGLLTTGTVVATGIIFTPGASSGAFLTSDATGRAYWSTVDVSLVGSATFAATAQVAQSLVYTPGASAGAFLTSDASGNTSWAALDVSLVASSTYAGTANVALDLYFTEGASSGAVLTSNGSGDTYWSQIISSAAGSATYVQYNDNGTLFGGSPAFTWVSSANTLSVSGIVRGHHFIGAIASSVSASAITPDSSVTDTYIITAQATGLTFNTPVGSAEQSQRLNVRIKDDGNSWTIGWGAGYRAVTTSLPTVTVPGATLYCGFLYNATDAYWDLVACSVTPAAATPSLQAVTAAGAVTTYSVQFQNATAAEFGADSTAGSSNVPGAVKFWSAGDNAYFTQFVAGTQTSSASYTLPTASVTGYLYNSSGTLSWLPPTTTTPAGSSTWLQFNNSGAFGADASLSWDDTSKVLVVGSNTGSAYGNSGVVHLSTRTTDSATAVMTTDAGGYWALSADSSYTCVAHVVGRNESVDSDSASYRLEFYTAQGSAVGTTEVQGLVKTTIYEVSSDWDATVVANTASGFPAITVTGSAGTNVRWSGRLEYVRVTG